MSNQTVGWAILGCAGIAATAMIPGIQASRNEEVLAVSSRNREKAAEYCRRFGVSKSYGSYQELLEDPAPIACNAAEAREMSEICRENNE